MQIRYRGMFAEIEIPAFGLVAKRDEVLTVTEDAARSLLAQGDNYEPVDADAKKVLKAIEKEVADRDVPDQVIETAVNGVGGVA